RIAHRARLPARLQGGVEPGAADGLPPARDERRAPPAAPGRDGGRHRLGGHVRSMKGGPALRPAEAAPRLAEAPVRLRPAGQTPSLGERVVQAGGGGLGVTRAGGGGGEVAFLPPPPAPALPRVFRPPP